MRQEINDRPAGREGNSTSRRSKLIYLVLIVAIVLLLLVQFGPSAVFGGVRIGCRLVGAGSC